MPKKHIVRAGVCLHDCVIPHERNRFRPLLFTMGGVAAVVTLMLLLQAAYFVQTRIVFKETDFLASILPGVLATLTNQDRARAGISTLTEDAHLARAAQMKAEDMAAKGYFAHVDPEGRQPWYWLQQAGYAYTYAGENLAVNFTDSEDVQKAWMNSPTHHANIVKREYTRIGIGVARGTYQGRDTTFVVQFFATPKAAAAPVPPPVVSEPVIASTAPAETEGEPASSEVLGAEADTVLPTEPDARPMLDAEYVAQGEVQGASAVAKTQSFFAQVAASPTHTLIYLLFGLSVLVSVLLLVSLAAHLKVAYLEVLGGGLIILLVALSLLIYNATSGSDVVIPDESQPASVIGAF